MKVSGWPLGRPLLVFVLALAWAHQSEAEVLKPLDVFKRCYIRMVRNVPNEADDLYKAVAAGTKTADVACAELFDLAKFNSNGVLINRTDAEAKAILRTFHEVHTSWFQSKTHTNLPATYLIHDGEEAPLYYTRAAFQPGAQFSTVVTLNTGLRGVRDQATYPVETSDFKSQRIQNYSADHPFAASTDLHLAYLHLTHDGKKYINGGTRPLVIPGNAMTEFGELSGVNVARKVTLPSFRRISRNETDVAKIVIDTLANFDANQHFGGGIIGSQAFYMNNANLGNNVLPMEYTFINRRLTARVFEDLLCHQLPTLTAADVKAEVKPASEHMFQRGETCMQCHSSIDGMGYGYRNMFITVTASRPQEAKDAVGLEFQTVTSLKPLSTATTFAAQMPEGRLHYRELITGTRRDFKFNSLSQLGTLLAGGADLYTCAAKRYYEFFTGVKVDLTQKATKALDKQHQDKVIALGKALKTHQSVRTLLKDIFASDAFRASDYLTEK
jgi:hypothetical protein